jgi:dipeptidase
MNDQGLALGESSCASRTVNYPKGQEKAGQIGALLDISTLMQLMLERCATARCAVETAGQLSEAHGFFPMIGEWSVGKNADGTDAYDDAGEALTVSDTTGDAWVFHVVGGAYGREAKSVWAAQRVPSGHAAFVANNFVIREVPEEPTEDFLFSSDLRGTAEALGFWHPSDGALDFARVFAPDTVTFRAPAWEAPIPMYASLRLWSLMRNLAPSLGLNATLDPLDLPWSVPVDHHVDHAKIKSLFRETYAGTEFDMSKGVMAGPFGNPHRAEGGPAMAHGQIPRAISIPRTVYGIIGQSRPGHNIMWYAVDTPQTSVYVPFYMAAGDAMAPAYGRGTNRVFSRDSAWWAFDFVMNWMQLNYRNMSLQYVFPIRDEMEAAIDSKRLEFEATNPTPAEMARWQVDVQDHVVQSWWELADFLVMAYNDNNFNVHTPGGSIGYPVEFANMVGFNQDVHPIFVGRVEPPQGPDANPLPSVFDHQSNQWKYSGPTAVEPQILIERQQSAVGLGTWVGTMMACVSFAFMAGRRFERASVDDKANAFLPLASS